ncbi:MAG: hypothetical protein QM689_09140 [Oscillospiraceae bacterium]
MRRFLQQQLLAVLSTIRDGVKTAKKLPLAQAEPVLADCFGALTSVEGVLEKNLSALRAAVYRDLIGALKAALEALYQALTENIRTTRSADEVDKQFHRIRTELSGEGEVRYEILFLPYQASMWDSLESVWQAAMRDPRCDVYVVAAPYYDRNADRSLGAFHDERDAFPADVQVMPHRNYDIAARRPDMIFIHNPYDGINLVTSVAPAYYASELKKHTERLIYIPYFVLDDTDPKDDALFEKLRHFALTPGVLNADRVAVQSERIKRIYCRLLADHLKQPAGAKTALDAKILGLGSPKLDRVTAQEAITLPEEWRARMFTADGRRKKTIFYNTSVSAFLEHNGAMLRQIYAVFERFSKRKETAVLLWRPHPLLRATILSMRPHLIEAFDTLITLCCESDWGILDDTPDLHRAIAVSDAYYGDLSSVVPLFQKTGKPVMIQQIVTSINERKGNP